MTPDFFISFSFHSQDDILYSRVRTSGIVTERYNIDGSTFEMYDVGGQRNERKKWIHCFEGRHFIIPCLPSFLPAFSLSHSSVVPLCVSFSFLFLSISFFLSHTHTQSLALYVCIFLSLSFPQFLSLSLFSLSLTFSLPLSFLFSLPLTFSLPLSFLFFLSLSKVWRQLSSWRPFQNMIKNYLKMHPPTGWYVRTNSTYIFSYLC